MRRKPRRPSLDELRTAFQTAEAAPPEAFVGGPHPEACPPPGVLFDAALGVLTAAEIPAVVDHVGRCPACAEGWRSARATPAGVAARIRGPDPDGSQ